MTAVAAALPPGVVEASQERGRGWDLWGTAAELLADLEANVQRSAFSPTTSYTCTGSTRPLTGVSAVLPTTTRPATRS